MELSTVVYGLTPSIHMSWHTASTLGPAWSAIDRICDAAYHAWWREGWNPMELVGCWPPPRAETWEGTGAWPPVRLGLTVRVAIMADGSAGARSLAQKLEHLFQTVHPRGRGPYSNNEVAAAIGDVSATYIWQLRKGLRTNPTKRHIEALAQFFKVDPAYFFDDAEADKIDERLALLATLRDTGASNVAARLVGLSPGSLEVVSSMLAQLRELEGLPDEITGQPPAERDTPEANGGEPEASQ
jgi:transcriptional regulator with XRE-family HTH domain